MRYYPPWENIIWQQLIRFFSFSRKKFSFRSLNTLKPLLNATASRNPKGCRDTPIGLSWFFWNSIPYFSTGNVLALS